MEEKGSTDGLDALVSKLLQELEESKKVTNDSEHLDRVIVVKHQLLREIRAFLEQKNKEAK
jgi:hypothetical protein